jgi:hypothetical protein
MPSLEPSMSVNSMVTVPAGAALRVALTDGF